MRQAELAATSLLERHSLIERTAYIALRYLTEPGGTSRADLIAARRLFAALRQSLLETAAQPA